MILCTKQVLGQRPDLPIPLDEMAFRVKAYPSQSVGAASGSSHGHGPGSSSRRIFCSKITRMYPLGAVTIVRYEFKNGSHSSLQGMVL